MKADDRYVSFAEGVVYRGLETPHLFHVRRDELYELDEDGLGFLDEVDGSRRASEIENRELLAFADSEGLLQYTEGPIKRQLMRGSSPLPSLRYLELILTLRCNLRCRHCYLDEPRPVDMDPGLLLNVVSEFDRMQGLRLLVSGGEPLLYPDRDRLRDMLLGRGYRVVLLTNGLLLDRAMLEYLPVHEVQVSIDGLEKGHDALRGPGTFARAVEAARRVAKSGKDLSMATMIHAGNEDEMEGLEKLVRDLGAREWSLEVPTETGRWTKPDEFSLPLEKAGVLISRGFGGSYHGSSGGYACGRHLAAVMPGGEVLSCGFYPDAPLGRVQEGGLRKAWKRKRVPAVSELDWCKDCAMVEECGGGCRYRARGPGPDPVMCAAYGWPRGRPKGYDRD